MPPSTIEKRVNIDKYQAPQWLGVRAKRRFHVIAWSVDPDAYGHFMSKVRDEWVARDFGKVLVNVCETLVAQHLGMRSPPCVPR